MFVRIFQCCMCRYLTFMCTGQSRAIFPVLHTWLQMKCAKEKQNREGEKRKMVGTTGFEPATSPTPRVRDTRLRYVPTVQLRSGLYSFIRLSLAFEKRQESAQRISQVQQHLPAQELRRSLSHATTRRTATAGPTFALARAILLAQMPPRSRNREPLVIHQPLNPQHHLHIFLPVKPVPARTLHRLQRRKLRPPLPQNKRLQSGQSANRADPVKILLNRRLHSC